MTAESQFNVRGAELIDGVYASAGLTNSKERLVLLLKDPARGRALVVNMSVEEARQLHANLGRELAGAAPSADTEVA